MSYAPVAPDLQVVPLTRDTLQERVYNQIADLILDGAIAPGQQVTIQGLARAFGVSAMPVREALKRLSAAGALTVVAGRSMGIPPLSRERLADLRDVRLELEGTATVWAARNIGLDEIAALDREFEHLERALRDGDPKEFLRANHAFHFVVYGAAGSLTMLTLIRHLWLQVSPYFNLLHASGNYVSANVQHRAIVDALKRGDGKQARRAVRADIQGSYEVLAALLSCFE